MNFLLLFFIYFKFFNFSTYFIFLATIIYEKKKKKKNYETMLKWSVWEWEIGKCIMSHTYALQWRVVLVMLILNALTVQTKQNCISFSIVKDFKNKELNQLYWNLLYFCKEFDEQRYLFKYNNTFLSTIPFKLPRSGQHIGIWIED